MILKKYESYPKTVSTLWKRQKFLTKNVFIAFSSSVLVFERPVLFEAPLFRPYTIFMKFPWSAHENRHISVKILVYSEKLKLVVFLKFSTFICRYNILSFWWSVILEWIVGSSLQIFWHGIEIQNIVLSICWNLQFFVSYLLNIIHIECRL